MSNENSLAVKKDNTKLQYYAEVIKRLFFQSKYVNLCKLCEEFLDELLDTLNQVVNKQKMILHGSLESYNNLAPIVEEVDEENQNELGVAGKIMKIQEKLNDVESNDEVIIEKYMINMKESKNYQNLINNENESLKALVIEIKEKLNSLENKEDQAKISPEKQESYVALVKRLDSMQNNFTDLQTYFKSMNNAQDEQNELEKIKKLLTQSNKKVSEFETKTSRLEKTLHEKGLVIESFTKQVLDLENQNTNLTKERDTVTSQRNAAEARLKVLQGTVKTSEKDQNRFAGIMLQKDQYIDKLETDKRNVELQLEVEKKTSSKKLEEINGSLKELTRLVKQKENEIESLRNLASEYQGENQKLVKSMIEKEKENNLLNLKSQDVQEKYERMRRDFDETLQKKVEENFNNVVSYMDEKDKELEQLRAELSYKELENNYISEAEVRKLKEMEDVVYNLAKELREKENENNELKYFIEEYKNVLKGIKEVGDFPFEVRF